MCCHPEGRNSRTQPSNWTTTTAWKWNVHLKKQNCEVVHGQRRWWRGRLRSTPCPPRLYSWRTICGRRHIRERDLRGLQGIREEIWKVVQSLEQTAREILTLLQGVHQGAGFQDIPKRRLKAGEHFGAAETHLMSLRRRQGHPTPVLLPGKSHGRRSLVGCGPWGR